MHATLAVCSDDNTRSCSSPCLRQFPSQYDEHRSVCVHGVPVLHAGHGSDGTYFPTYKAAANQYARSRPCNQSNRGIRLVTIQSRPSDRDAGGTGASCSWPQARLNPPESGFYAYTTFFCIPPPISHLVDVVVDLSHPFVALSHRLSGISYKIYVI